MKAALNLIGELDEQTIRSVHRGEVSRSSLKSLAQEKGFPQTAGKSAHRLIRAYEDIDSFIGFHKYGRSYAGELGVDVDADLNHARVSVYYPNGRPSTSVEDLIEDRGLDLEGFEVASQKHNEWTVSSREDHGWETKRNHQVDVRLTRKKRKPEFPEPQPVHVEAPAVEPPDVEVGDSPKPEGWRTALLITDTHHGFRRHEATGDLHPLHDRHAIDLVKQVAGLANINEVNHLGDGIDAPSISAYDNAPDLRRTLQPSLLELDYDLTQIRHAAQPDTVRYLEGNHCERIREKLLEEAEELYGLKDVDAVRENRPPQLSLRSLLRFEQKGIEWVGDYPDSEIMLNEGVSIAHDYELGSKSGHTVYKVLRDNHGEISRIQGHGHRHERAFYTNWEGQTAKEYWAAMLGCLCRLDGIVEGVKARQNWQQSFALLHYDPNGWAHTFEPIKVYPSRTGSKRKRECYFRGCRLRSRDPDLEALSGQTNWRFTYTDGVMA